MNILSSFQRDNLKGLVAWSSAPHKLQSHPSASITGRQTMRKTRSRKCESEKKKAKLRSTSRMDRRRGLLRLSSHRFVTNHEGYSKRSRFKASTHTTSIKLNTFIESQPKHDGERTSRSKKKEAKARNFSSEEGSPKQKGKLRYPILDLLNVFGDGGVRANPIRILQSDKQRQQQ